MSSPIKDWCYYCHRNTNQGLAHVISYSSLLFLDACVTTEKWQPATTFSCPDICPSKGYEFDGNIADPSNKRHYVACWKGMNVGCVACPAGLEFNEQLNACLYEGRYVTEPVHDSNNGVYNPPTARPTARPRPRPTRRTTPRRGGPIYLNPFDYRL